MEASVLERHREQETAEPPRFLVVPIDGPVGPKLVAKLNERLPASHEAEVRVIVPGPRQGLMRRLLGEADEADDEAALRLAQSLAELERCGIRARGDIGDNNPEAAVEEALAEFAADAILFDGPLRDATRTRARRRARRRRARSLQRAEQR